MAYVHVMLGSSVSNGNTWSNSPSCMGYAPAVTVNVGRAGAASLDVIQEVEYVKQEAKVVYLLECLQKTPPPVRIHAGETLVSRSIYF